MALLTVENLSFTYPASDTPALSGVSLSIERGEFLTLMGPTGSGKSTLLRLLKPELRQNGTLEGDIRFDGRDITSLSPRESAEKIGYVAQSPDEQLVTDKVWHELSFTLENLGAPRELIARRIAEISSYFDIDALYDRDTSTLSGGQKQLVNLAAITVADPEMLILDEPTAQLDPIAAARFIDTLRRLNRETGLTVVISEHRAEELIPISDRVLILDGGRVACLDAPRRVAASLGNGPFVTYMPAASQIFSETNGTGEPPLSIREGQAYVSGLSKTIRSVEKVETAAGEIALALKNIYFRYERKGTDILRDLSLDVRAGEVLALLGANGAGKSTLATVAAGLKKPYSGRITLFGKKLGDYKNGSLYQHNLSLLPQDAESVFIRETVREELRGCEKTVASLPYDLSPLLDRHPYDISGGERQLVALCKALATEPRLLILDEPSKGLDGNAKQLLCDVIKKLKESGVTVLLISHDIEFAALCADRCALFSQGGIAAIDDTARFMNENRFYTTSASRITRRSFDGGYTVERAARLINGGAV